MTRWLLPLLVACGGDRAPAPAPREAPRDARVATAPADAAGARGYVGVITASDSVDIAPRFQGVVATIDVRVGDTVVANQVVASMDKKSMQEELRAAEAALGASIAAKRQAEVDVDDARRKVALETKAVADGVSPRTILEEAQFGLKRAQAASERASSTVAAESSHVQTARDHVSDTALRAPTAGTVAMRFKDPGATVPAGGAILRIVGRGGLRLRFAVPPDEAHLLAAGGIVHAMIETIATPVDATIRQVAPALDQASGMIILEAELSPDATASAQLRPGLAARVK